MVMKKVILALAALTTFGLAFTSCGSDDEPSQKTEKFLSAPSTSDLSFRADADNDGMPDGYVDEESGTNTGIVSVETSEEGKVSIGLIPTSPLERRVYSYDSPVGATQFFRVPHFLWACPLIAGLTRDLQNKNTERRRHRDFD